MSYHTTTKPSFAHLRRGIVFLVAIYGAFFCGRYSVRSERQLAVVRQVEKDKHDGQLQMVPVHKDREDLTPVSTVSSLRGQVTVSKVIQHQGQTVVDYKEKEEEALPTRVIVLLAMGDVTKSKIVERNLYSIRSRGQWNGPVLLITDAGPERYRALQESSRLFVVHPPTEDWNDDLKNSEGHLYQKRFKTYIIDYVDSIPELATVELVYYLDLDIVVGAPLDNLYTYIEAAYNIQGGIKTDTSSRIFFWKGDYRANPAQSGQFIMERPRSNGCLHEWRKLIDMLGDDNNGRDQNSLAMMYKGKVEADCEIILLEQEPHLYFTNRKFMKNSIDNQDFKTLNHVKNHSRYTQMESHRQREFLRQVLNLSEEEAQETGLAEQMLF